MVAALLGAEACACEEGAALQLLQHNAATFNSEFNKCKPIITCSFPVSEQQRGNFDLVLVTDHLHSPSARIQTVQSLLALLDKNTECVVAHTWRRQASEQAFFEALGRCLVVRRVDGQRSIQGKCAHSLNRSIADSARDIMEATDEDGSIDIFSLRPHADVSPATWREELQRLLLDLQKQDASPPSSPLSVTPFAKEVAATPSAGPHAVATAATLAPATLEDALGIKHGKDKLQSQALTSCSTLCSLQKASLNSSVSSDLLIPGHSGAALSTLVQETATRAQPRQPTRERTASATATGAATKPPAHSSFQRNSSQALLQQQQQLPNRKREATADEAAKSSAAAMGIGSPAASTPVRPQSSIPSGAVSQQQLLLQQQQPLPVIAGSPSARRASMGATTSAIQQSHPFPRSVGQRNSGSPSPSSPIQPTGTAAAPAAPAAAPALTAAAAAANGPPAGSSPTLTSSGPRAAKAATRAAVKPAAAKPAARAPATTSLKSAMGTAKPALQKTAAATAAATAARLSASAAAQRPCSLAVAHPAAATPAFLHAAGLGTPVAATGLKNLGSLLPSLGVAPSALPQRAAQWKPVAAAAPAAAAAAARPQRARAAGSVSAVAATQAGADSLKRLEVSEEKLSTAGCPAANSPTGGEASQKKLLAAAARAPKAAATAAKRTTGGAQGETPRGLAPAAHITPAGPLGSRLVLRLSSLFKRSGSKEARD